MTVLLTGASGFLGSHLVKGLLAQGHDVLALRRAASNLWRLEREKDRVQWFELEADGLEQPFKQGRHIDAVIHTANCYGRNQELPSRILETNVLFSVRLFETASRFKAGTFFNTDTYFNTATCAYDYLAPYSLSKRQCAEWLERLAGQVKVVNLKLQHVYGPLDDPSKFTTSVMHRCLESQPSIDLTAGEQKRDFIHVNDVVNAYLHLLTCLSSLPGAFTTFSVGTGTSVSIREFVETVHRLSHSKSVLRFGALPYRENEISCEGADISQLRNTGWTPTIGLVDGIRRMLREEKGSES